MKKRLFLAVIAVLIVCLMCGVLLVACNEPDPPVVEPPVTPPGGDDEDDGITASEAFIAVVNGLNEVEQDTSGEKEFNFGLQIRNRATMASVFSIALENYEGNDYLYGAVGTAVYSKFNGFNLGETFMTVFNWLGDLSISFGGGTISVDATTLSNPIIAEAVAEMALGEVAVSGNGTAYMLELGLSKLLPMLSGLNIDQRVNELIGADTVATIVDIVADLIGLNLTAENMTVMGLLNALANAYQVNFYFGFDGSDNADPFDELMPGVAAARTATAKNLLNFEGEIIIEGLDANNEIENTYVLDIDVDINPFVALGLLDLVEASGNLLGDGMELNPDFTIGWRKDVDFIGEVMAMLEDAGYIHISLDKYAGTDTEATPVRNLFTLHYDSAEGKAVVSVATNKVTVGEEELALAAGGVYDIDALAQVINTLINGNAVETPAEGVAEGDTPHTHVDANGDGICDDETCKQISNVMDYVMGKLPALGNCFTIENGTFDINEEALAAVAQQVLNDTAYLTKLTSDEIGGFVTAFQEFAASIGYNTETGLALSGDELADLVNEVLTTLKDKEVIKDADLTDAELAAFVEAARNIEGLINFTTTGGLQIGVDNALNIAETFLKFFFPDKAEAIGTAKAYVSDLLGGHAKIRIKVAQGAFSFGHFEENEKVAFEDLVFNLNDSSDSDADQAYVETITAISKDGEGEIAVGDVVTVTGTAFDGTAVTTEGVVMAIGADGTYYVGIYTDLNTNLGKLESIINSFVPADGTPIDINIQPSWPFYGVLACPATAVQA